MCVNVAAAREGRGSKVGEAVPPFHPRRPVLRTDIVRGHLVIGAPARAPAAGLGYPAAGATRRGMYEAA